MKKTLLFLTVFVFISLHTKAQLGIIKGQVKYFNQYETVMPQSANIKIAIDNNGVLSQEQFLQYLPGSNQGFYQFNNITEGTSYTIRLWEAPIGGTLADTWSWNNWCGVNSLDALIISSMYLEIPSLPVSFPWLTNGASVPIWTQYFGGFTGHNYNVANVNSDNTINNVDAVLAMYRSIGWTGTSPFPSGAFNFQVAGQTLAGGATMTYPLAPITVFTQHGTYLPTNAANSVYYKATITGSAGTQVFNIYYAATGDVNASYVPVSISIAASQNPVYAGTSVTFTATPTNGGTVPTYQWMVNGNTVSGTTNAIYTYVPANNDNVKCVLTSNISCITGNPAISNIITMTVNQIMNVPCPGTPTVTYDGQTYNTVKIGDQCWFKENLNVGTKINGDLDQTNNNIIEKFCFNDQEVNCDVYGGLYQWNEMMQYVTNEGVKGICPIGWHLPTDAEWITMTTSLGGEGIAGGKMKESGLEHWLTPNTGATNLSGFSALPAGLRGTIGGVGAFNEQTIWSIFWSSSEHNSADGWRRNLTYNAESASRNYEEKYYGFSIRCLKDCDPPSSPTQGTHLPSPTQIIWNWNPVTGATGYKWSTTDSYATATDMGAATTKIETGLTCNTQYTRWLWAYNACGNSTPVILTQMTSACTPANCLVAYYPFNGNANDMSGNGNQGIVYGAALTTDRHGNSNSAYAFNGVSGWIKVENSPSLNINGNVPLSLCAWVYTSSSINQGIVCKWGPDGEDDDQYLLQIEANRYSFGLSDEPTFISTNLSIINNAWVFVVGVYDTVTHTSKIYIDGNLDNSKALNFSIWNRQQYIEIGRIAEGRYLNGKIDDIRIYNCALTESEITTLYNEGTTDTASVTTTATSNVTQTSAISGGTIISDGGTTVTARGVCWSTSSTPTLANSHTADGSGTGTYISTISGLSPSTPYYVRAYATNSVGTAYGNQVTFTSLANGASCPNIPTVTYEGKTYNTVQIGNQCWFKENLNIGTKIGVSTEQTNNGVIEKYCYSNLESNCDVYGGLYQWNELMNYSTSSNLNPSGIQGLCPPGWHIPSDAEWCQLETYLDPTVNCNATSNRGTDAGGKMKEPGTNHWGSPNTGATNLSGLTSLPSGYRSTGNYFSSLGSNGFFWSSAKINNLFAWGRYLSSFNAQVGRAYNSQIVFGYAGRCLKDSDGSSSTPSVTTTTATNIMEISAISGGTVISVGDVTAKGVCWSTSPSPTVLGSHTTDGTGTGTFISNISGLTPGTLYYISAYAVNNIGIAYGNEMSFSTLVSANLPTVITAPTTSTNTTATSGGNVTNEGGSPVTARGVIWCVCSQGGDISLSTKTIDGSGAGSFTSNITGLQPNYDYYFRAYATNSFGTGYGQVIFSPTW